MTVKRQSIYVAGAYRSKWGIPGKIINILKAYRVGRRLTKQGYCVYIPHMNTALMDIGCNTDQFFLDCGIKMLKKFEIIYMMKGWWDSEGAKQEHTEALRRGIEVRYEKLYPFNPNWKPGMKETLPFSDIEPLTTAVAVPFTTIEPGKTVNCQIKADSSFTSKCCHAGVNIDGDDVEGTHYWTCAKCGKPCDLESQLKEIAENGK